MVLDLRIPQNQRYQQIVLDTSVARFLAGELNTDATVKAIKTGWEEIGEDLGASQQLQSYRQTIGAK